MYIFIDESGTHKDIDHSTFVLVYVAVNDYQTLERKVQALEARLRRGAFHWKDTVWKVKKEFMEEALSFDFRIKIAVFRNPINTGAALELALTHMIVERDITEIFIDGKKPKKYARVLKKSLRDKGIRVSKLRTVNDEQFAGIRLADMAAGLSRSYFDNKNLNKITPYFERLQKKTIIIIEQ